MTLVRLIAQAVHVQRTLDSFRYTHRKSIKHFRNTNDVTLTGFRIMKVEWYGAIEKTKK